jgi:AcrR family transcriptional regulator
VAISTAHLPDSAPAGRGTRSRAGNAMGRTRDAALAGALAAIVKYGSHKATMGDIAMLAGIAKATLYNHFRTRDDVYAAVVAAQVEAIGAAADAKLADGFAAAVAEAGRLLAEHPALRRVAAEEPGVLAALATPTEGPTWAAARARIADALTRAGYVPSAAAVDLVLRHLLSQLLAPSQPADRIASAALLTTAVAQASADDPPSAADHAAHQAAEPSSGDGFPAPARDSAPAGSADTSS